MRRIDGRDVAVVVLGGFTIGALIAVFTSGVAQRNASAPPVATVTVTPTAVVAAPTGSPRATLVPATRAPATAPPATPLPATPTPTPVAALASRSSVPVVRPSAAAGPRTTWTVDEANTSVGRIVWTGDASDAGGTLVLRVHKTSIANQGATRCERDTVLETTIVVGAGRQTVPFQEVNCNGLVSQGETVVNAVSADRSVITGTFREDGRAVGTFTASAH